MLNFSKKVHSVFKRWTKCLRVNLQCCFRTQLFLEIRKSFLRQIFFPVRLAVLIKTYSSRKHFLTSKINQKFIEKYLYRSLLCIKVPNCKLQACNFFKERLRHRCFPANFQKHLFYRASPGACFYNSTYFLRKTSFGFANPRFLKNKVILHKK